MKSTLRPIILFALISSASAHGDASFVFRNYVPPEVAAPVFDSSGNRLSGTHYVAVLYGGRTPDSLTLARLGATDMPPESLTAVFNGQEGYFSTPGYVWIPDVGGLPGFRSESGTQEWSQLMMTP
jgi:hypothetical protein